mmetsp:Transcript_74188/g.199165  ORF Transcript_74188/g.199165 Transcript_74188/m.199165 type:complete len:91 (-) Transcript_74188:120-392(-)
MGMCLRIMRLCQRLLENCMDELLQVLWRVHVRLCQLFYDCIGITKAELVQCTPGTFGNISSQTSFIRYLDQGYNQGKTYIRAQLMFTITT